MSFKDEAVVWDVAMKSPLEIDEDPKVLHGGDELPDEYSCWGGGKDSGGGFSFAYSCPCTA